MEDDLERARDHLRLRHQGQERGANPDRQGHAARADRGDRRERGRPRPRDARELNSKATIVAAVREEENVHLLHQSGASSVITSSGAAGRLLGQAVHAPRVTEVLEDLLSVGEGLDIEHRPVDESELGQLSALKIDRGIVVGVIRGDELIRFDDPRASELRAGDQVVYLHSHRA
jgi:Trk K+ transport system NAD-binding subunit